MDIGEQLIRDEGMRLKPYRDTRGKLTIGVGRNLDDVGITKEEAYVMLIHDIKTAAQAVKDLIPISRDLDAVRVAALVNLCFNMGPKTLLTFKRMISALEARDFERAAMELLDSDYEEQVGPRAHRVARQLLTGEWQ